MDTLIEIIHAVRSVAGHMAPYLLFGFFAAGGLHVLVSPEWMRSHLGGKGLAPVVKSVLLGVPLPLCSCGVIAVTAAIRRQGAGKGAATGFLLATPQTGVDSIFATWGMLGPVLAVFRPIIALITGIIGGGLVTYLDKEAPEERPRSDQTCHDACCTAQARPRRTVTEALRYGLMELPRDIAVPLAVGIAVTGLITALAPEKILEPYIGGGFLAMLAMIAVGIPMYVCATASIPVALGFMHLGASPGAALAFLIAGPATNAATIATVWKIMGRRATLIYLGTVAAASVLFGLLFDAIDAGNLGMTVAAVHHASHGEAYSVWNTVAALALGGVVLHSVCARRIAALFHPQRMHARNGSVPNAVIPQQVRLQIQGMRCGHCVKAVSQALSAVQGVASVKVDLAGGTVVITGSALHPATLLRTVEGLGYTVAMSTE